MQSSKNFSWSTILRTNLRSFSGVGKVMILLIMCHFSFISGCSRYYRLRQAQHQMWELKGRTSNKVVKASNFLSLRITMTLFPVSPNEDRFCCPCSQAVKNFHFLRWLILQARRIQPRTQSSPTKNAVAQR